VITKAATAERPAYLPALHQIKAEISRLLVSFGCQVKIVEG